MLLFAKRKVYVSLYFVCVFFCLLLRRYGEVSVETDFLLVTDLILGGLQRGRREVHGVNKIVETTEMPEGDRVGL